ncbi:MAG: hypothetical protein ACK5PS_03945 [Desulfopila sp.]
MEQGDELFARDYAELQEILELYPGISILSVDTDPYMIEYRLFAMAYGYDKDDAVVRRRILHQDGLFGKTLLSEV